MKPRYLQEESAGRDRWTISYVDVLTILLIFFIAVAARMPAKPATPPPVEKPAPVEKPLLETLRDQLAAKGLDVHLEQRGVVISLPQTILFAPGDDAIARAARPAIEQ